MYKIPNTNQKISTKFTKPKSFKEKLHTFFINQNSLLLQVFDETSQKFVHFSFIPSPPSEQDLLLIKVKKGDLDIQKTNMLTDDPKSDLKSDPKSDLSSPLTTHSKEIRSIGEIRSETDQIDKKKITDFTEEQFLDLSVDENISWIQNLMREHQFDIFDLFSNEFICGQDFALIYAKDNLDEPDVLEEVLKIKQQIKLKYQIIDQKLRSEFPADQTADFCISTLKNCEIETLKKLSKSLQKKYIINNVVEKYYKFPQYITDPYTFTSIKMQQPNISRKEKDFYKIMSSKTQKWIYFNKLRNKVKDYKIPTTFLGLFKEQCELSPYHGQCFGCGCHNLDLNMKYLCFACWKILMRLYLNPDKDFNILLNEFNNFNQTLKFIDNINVDINSDVNVIKY